MTCFWAVMLRSSTTMHVINVISLMELAKHWRKLEILMRRDTAMRLIILRLPSGTHREQVSAAFELLSEEEMVRLYRLPQAIFRGRVRDNQHDTAPDCHQSADDEIAVGQLVAPDAVDHKPDPESRQEYRRDSHDGILAVTC